MTTQVVSGSDIEAFLVRSGAQNLPHSGRTLLAHLQGTHRLLAEWGNPPDVALAGMFHSVYGTNAFRHMTVALPQRDAVRELIGEAAEALAYVFCSIDRPHAITGAATKMEGNTSGACEIPHRNLDCSITVSHSQLRQLVELEAANLIEQGSQGRQLEDLFFLAYANDEWLSAAAHQALRQHLKAATAQGVRGCRAPPSAPATHGVRT